MNDEDREMIRHIQETGRRNVEKYLGDKVRCRNERCPITLMLSDFTDAELEAAMKLLGRMVHVMKIHYDTFFAHVVAEYAKRNELVFEPEGKKA